ncbi:MAG: hypothetical protein HY243_06745 [Proteobacteria bacterium]|nr:hypothetical protein [Pseudomonadota bacterium]
MTKQLFYLSLGAGLLLTLQPAPAMAEAPWSGPGWYLSYSETGFDDELVSGPYEQQAECESAKAADHSHDSDRDGLGCEYLGQDDPN